MTGFIECNTDELLTQIGRGNLMAISGCRVVRRETGVTLPVDCGYSVTLDLAAGDTNTVRRIFSRGGRSWRKGERAVTARIGRSRSGGDRHPAPPAGSPRRDDRW